MVTKIYLKHYERFYGYMIERIMVYGETLGRKRGKIFREMLKPL